MIAGSAFHKYAELIYSGMDRGEALRKAHEYIENIKDQDVDWGKTGSREKVVKELSQVIEFFEAEKTDYGETLATEYKKTVTPRVEGRPFPLPVKAVTDLVVRKKNGRIGLIDWKVVGFFTDPSSEDAIKIIQAIFNYFTVSETMGEEPEDMTFAEIKRSKNKDGSPQIQYYTIEYDKHPEYFKYWARMYSGIIESLSNPNFQFLPNFSDMLGADEAWSDFTNEVMDFSMPEQVVHKPKHIQNVERKYVESLIDTGADAPTTPEGKIMAKLLEFGATLDFAEKFVGPNVSLFGFKPSRGLRMSTLDKYDKDLQLALESKSVRILAPIPGKKLVGVEVANDTQTIVPLSSAPKTKALELPIGVDVYNKPHVIDLAKAPHLLVAGATGAGKSVALSVMISTLMKNNRELDLGMILIDPKRSEFIDFAYASHLINPVITEAHDAEVALEWAVEEMEERYKKLMGERHKNIDSYRAAGGSMQKIVIVIDELADLILGGGFNKGIEGYIIRLAQKARAVGIHLIVATQRPSVDVVTGILKANFPTRLAFMTATQVDSKVILDQAGADKLLGNGDCLLMQPRHGLQRLQGYYQE